jgi:hypothetical protein
MPDTLFCPAQIDLPETIILVPWLPAECRPAKATTRRLLHAELLIGQHSCTLTGFLGYPDLLTLLAFIAGLPGKRIYLAGTAGALAPRVMAPAVVQVASIAATPPLRSLSRRSPLEMETIPAAPWPAVKAVSVDLAQRETRPWLAAQRREGRQAVEMELFALRAFLGRPFPALLVFSDAVEPGGIRPFARSRVRQELARAFAFLMELAHETKNNPDPQVPG